MKEPKKAKGHSHAAPHRGHDHSSEKKRLNRIKGQLEGVQRMIDEHRYCPEILTQVRAVRAALKALESSILENHLRSCVQAAMKAQDHHESEAKIRELIQLFQGAGA